MARFLSWVLLALIALAPPASSAEPLRVVATFTILGDWVNRIGAEDIDLTVLIGPDQDPHGFEPSPRQQAAIAKADLVVANGLGLEPWLERVLRAAEFKGRLLIASNGITPIRFTSDQAGSSSPEDPHAFQDPDLALIYVRNIEAEIAAADPSRASRFSERAEQYVLELKAARDEIQQRIDTLAPARRRVLTSHDAFNYFGRAFGIEFVPIQPGLETKEISPSNLTSILEEARLGGLAVVFVENMTDPRLAETIAADSGIRIGGVLYADALSPPDGPAPDYLTLLRHNAQTLIDGFR